MGGYIYVATTASRPAEVKIGCTTGSPQKRMRELSIPSRQMVLLYAEEATDARMLEREVHAVLAHARVHSRYEFFAVTVAEAKQAIRRAKARIRARGNKGLHWNMPFPH